MSLLKDINTPVFSPEDILERHWNIKDATLRPIASGLINDTFHVRDLDGRGFVLQKVNPIFDPGAHQDLEDVLGHLKSKAMRVPELFPTTHREYHVVTSEGTYRVWRYLDLHSFDAVNASISVASMGALVARTHEALLDYTKPFQRKPRSAHDLPAYLGSWESARDAHQDHDNFRRVTQIVEHVCNALEELPKLNLEPKVIAHGDLKISNIMFDTQGEAQVIIDWDTVAPMPWIYEMGDALRSWCNEASEDESPRLNMQTFEDARSGYLGVLPHAESWWDQALFGAATISFELSLRFATDALNENYFGWDPSRFKSRSEHNSMRAQSMYQLGCLFVEAAKR